MGATPSVLANELRLAGVHDELARLLEEHHGPLQEAHCELHRAHAAEEEEEEEAAETDEDGKAPRERERARKEKMRAVLREKCQISDEEQLSLILDTVDTFIARQRQQQEQEETLQHGQVAADDTRDVEVQTGAPEAPAAAAASGQGHNQQEQEPPQQDKAEGTEDAYATLASHATYEPRPRDTDKVELSQDLIELTELLAENTHEEWAQQRVRQGWSYGPARDDSAKLHPCLVPYGQLSDEEKEYDRITAMKTLKLLVSFGYTIEAPQQKPRTQEAHE